jgi:hypothetical protein
MIGRAKMVKIIKDTVKTLKLYLSAMSPLPNIKNGSFFNCSSSAAMASA